LGDVVPRAATRFLNENPAPPGAAQTGRFLFLAILESAFRFYTTDAVAEQVAIAVSLLLLKFGFVAVQVFEERFAGLFRRGLLFCRIRRRGRLRGLC
jgi:hypothetical protein